MFIFTTKLNRRKIILTILVLALIISAIILLSPTRVLVTGGESDLAMAEQAMKKKAGSDEERAEFLRGFGWEIEEKPLEICEVVIPKEFDEVYSAYNEIQKDQGYNLLKYKGKTATMYTYKVLNHPSGETETRANVLVYKEKVIGGDVCSLNLDGFMHGFGVPETSEKASLEEESTDLTEEAGNVDGEEIGTSVNGLFEEE